MTLLNVAARLTETITVKRITARSTGGDPTRSTSLTMKARIQRTNSDATLGVGRDNVDADVVFTTTELVVGDLVFYPEANTGDVNTGRYVKSVARHVALDGTTTHWTATL